MYLLEEPKRNFISSFLDCPNNTKENLPWVMQTRPMETLGEISDILKPIETPPKGKGHGT